MRRGERVNASTEPADREFGLAADRDLPEELAIPAGGDAPARAFLDSMNPPPGALPFTPPSSPKPIGDRDEAGQKPASEAFRAAARQQVRPTGTPNPQTRSRPKVATSGDQGPCLYFGPAGERCDRRALRDGYCSAHLASKPNQLASTDATAGPAAEKPYQRTIKVVSALIALLGFLAPLLENVIREFLRWLHSH